MEGKLALSDAIENVREEIAHAIEKGEGKAVKFVLNEIDLELGVELEAKGSLGGKADIYVAHLGAEGTKSGKHVHRIKIKLTPVDGNGGPFTVSRQAPRPR